MTCFYVTPKRQLRAKSLNVASPAWPRIECDVILRRIAVFHRSAISVWMSITRCWWKDLELAALGLFLNWALDHTSYPVSFQFATNYTILTLYQSNLTIIKVWIHWNWQLLARSWIILWVSRGYGINLIQGLAASSDIIGYHEQIAS